MVRITHEAELGEMARSALANHFIQHNHSMKNLKVTAVERVFGTKIYRKTKEAFWIKKLNTLEPEGLNTMYER